MQIQSLSTVAAEKIACIFVHLALFVGTLSSCKMLLCQIKCLSINNCFMRIFKDKNIFGIVLQPFLQLVGFGIGFEIYSVTYIFLIFVLYFESI